jgi:D-amino-acid oxidase
MLDPATYPKGTRIGFKYDSIMINAPHYITYLLEKAKDLGAVIVSGALPTSSDLGQALITATNIIAEEAQKQRPIAAFVNATGLGAMKLVPDANMFPIRGQTITVAGHAEKITTINFAPDAEKPADDVITYILPRPGSTTTVIGGTKQKGNWSSEPDPETTKELLQRAKPYASELLDDKGEFNIISEQVGFRPGRRGGPRIELENVGKFIVCHAYGHAGAGEYMNVISFENILTTYRLSKFRWMCEQGFKAD